MTNQTALPGGSNKFEGMENPSSIEPRFLMKEKENVAVVKKAKLSSG